MKSFAVFAVLAVVVSPIFAAEEAVAVEAKTPEKRGAVLGLGHGGYYNGYANTLPTAAYGHGLGHGYVGSPVYSTVNHGASSLGYPSYSHNYYQGSVGHGYPAYTNSHYYRPSYYNNLGVHGLGLGVHGYGADHVGLGGYYNRGLGLNYVNAY